jgi:hypothetical protein
VVARCGVTRFGAPVNGLRVPRFGALATVPSVPTADGSPLLLRLELLERAVFECHRTIL